MVLELSKITNNQFVYKYIVYTYILFIQKFEYSNL